MADNSDRMFDVSSVGRLHPKSLSMLADHLEDENGNTIDIGDLSINQTFFVIFVSGTGTTRTSAQRIA